MPDFEAKIPQTPPQWGSLRRSPSLLLYLRGLLLREMVRGEEGERQEMEKGGGKEGDGGARKGA